MALDGNETHEALPWRAIKEPGVARRARLDRRASPQ